MKTRLFIFLAVLPLLCACAPRYETVSGYAQGGTFSVRYNASGVKAPVSEIAAGIDSILLAVDTTLSGYNKKSILSRRNAGEEVELSDMFRDIESISEHYREITGGAFDVAAGPLFDVWGFGFTSDSLPSEERIAEAIERCRRREVLNFNAIAQGYTCDLVADFLHRNGVKDMLVDIGEIYCEGVNPKGLGWSIGIDTPEDGNEIPGAKLSGIWRSDGRAHGVVTSGNYRKFYIRDGRKYAHTIDPRTGRPVEHNLLSATVVAPTATEADALATFFMVVGFDEARAWVESHDDLEACLITTDGPWTSEGFYL
ncbi:MAG: FAD:protein FMN transferase [Bacteroidales bacterium]|nr:FAD:protein FMN transferase [Bacteroidales bacterium]